MATVTGTGPYTVTLTAREQTVAARVAARNGVTVTKALEGLVERKLNEFFQQHQQQEAAARHEAYTNATAPVKASVDAALNFTPET
jgi:hypothetical protein